MDNRVLEEISKTLNADAWNYAVFLRFFEVPLPRPIEKETIIKTALGAEATLSDIQEVEKASVWPAVRANLLYAGDDGAGPASTTIKSAKLLALMSVLEDEVRDLVDEAITIESFELQKGHPAYPVFWDFAFLFLKNANASILIGSSSD